MKKKKAFLVPRNDLEAVEIINLLRQCGERVVVSQQRWGARWENLEPEVEAEVERLIAENPDLEIVGVELAGTPRWGGSNIDHHRWSDGDRRHEESSLEQVASLLEVELSPYLRLVAENDKGWIPALRRAGATAGEIEYIRLTDRCSQGVTPDDEAEAVRAISEARWVTTTVGKGAIVSTTLSSFQLSPISDRLFNQADEWLIAASNAWLYNGPRHQELFSAVKASGEGSDRDWSGGSPKSGYAGFVKPSETLRKILRSFCSRNNTLVSRG